MSKISNKVGRTDNFLALTTLGKNASENIDEKGD